MMELTSLGDSASDVQTQAPRIPFPPVRFGAETVLISISILFNLLGIFVVNRAQKAKASAYHIFYFNLACTNIAVCPLSWFCNNMIFIFNDWFSNNLYDPVARCAAGVYASTGVFATMSVGIQMTLSMVGLGMVQYFAICQPLKSLYVLQRKRTFRFIICSCLISVTCAGLPMLVLSWITATQPCTDQIFDNIMLSVIVVGDIYMIITFCLYIVLMVMAFRVYAAIKKYAERVGKYNADKDKLEQDKKAFQTTMILLLSVTLFTVPINLWFLISVNIGGGDAVLQNVVLFYILMMPCTKCIADPIIYGSRMREVALEWRRVICCQSKDTPHVADGSQTGNASGTYVTGDGSEAPKDVNNKVALTD